MPQPGALTILCIATYEKGQTFLRECHRLGHTVLLLTVEKLRDADWPREAIAETFYIPRDIQRDELLKGVSHIARLPRGRPHRAARRLRRRDGGHPARAPPHPGDGRDDGPLLPRQAGDARQGAERRHPRARVRARAERPGDRALRGDGAGALGAQAALLGGRHRDQPHRRPRRPVARHRGARRSAVVLPARAVRARRRVPRGLDRLGARDRVPRGASLRPAADEHRARGRRVHDAHAARRTPRTRTRSPP